MKHSLSYLLAFFALGSLTAIADPIKPTAIIVPPQGQLLDDPFALSSDGASIAYLTIAGEAATLHVRPTAVESDWTLATLPWRPDAIEWIDAQHLLLTTGRRGAVVTVKKGVRALPGEYDAIGATKQEKGASAVVLQRRIKSAGKPELQVRLLDPDTLAELADRSYPVDAAGTVTIGKVGIKPIAFEEGYRVLIGLREGVFDKQRDMRLPAAIVSVDLARAKIFENPEPTAETADPMFVANLTAERKIYANKPRFVAWNGDRSGFVLVDGTKLGPLRWDRPVALYDAETLQSGTVDVNTLWMAIKVEPLNPIAMEKKRRDADELEIYTIDRARQQPERRLVLDGLGRSANVAVRGSTVAVFRRQKVVARGGIAIEIYPVGAQSTAQVPGATSTQ